MRKLILLLLIALVVFVVWNKQRVFVRDPLAGVLRDNAKPDGEQVYINFTSDVLLENDNSPSHIMLVQHGQPLGVPTKLRCIHWVACLTDADKATTLPLGGAAQTMNSKTVAFREGNGQRWVVTLY